MTARGLAGPMAMASMMMSPYAQDAAGWGQMMQGGLGFWWGPTLGNIVIGGGLSALSRPIGRLMGSGLDD